VRQKSDACTGVVKAGSNVANGRFTMTKKPDFRGILAQYYEYAPRINPDDSRRRFQRPSLADLEEIILGNVTWILIVFVLVTQLMFGAVLWPASPVTFWLLVAVAYVIGLHLFGYLAGSVAYDSQGFRSTRIVAQSLLLVTLVSLTGMEWSPYWPALLLPGFVAHVYFHEKRQPSRIFGWRHAVAVLIFSLFAGVESGIILALFTGARTTLISWLLAPTIFLILVVLLAQARWRYWSGAAVLIVLAIVFFFQATVVSPRIAVQVVGGEVGLQTLPDVTRAAVISGWLILLGLVIKRLYDFFRETEVYIGETDEYRRLQGLASATDLQQLNQRLVRFLLNELGGINCSLYLADDQRQVLTLSATAQQRFLDLPKQVSFGEGLIGRMALEAFDSDASVADLDDYTLPSGATGIQLVAPIMVRRRLYGVLWLIRESSTRRRRTDIHFLRSVNRLLPQLIDRARLNAAVQQFYSQRSRLVSDLDLLQPLKDLVNYDEAVLYEEINGRFFPLDSDAVHNLGVAQQALLDRIRNGSPLVFDNIFVQIAGLAEAGYQGNAAWLAVPIHDQSGFRGALLVGDHKPGAFSDDDLAVLTEFGHHLARFIGDRHSKQRLETAVSILERLMNLSTSESLSPVTLQESLASDLKQLLGFDAVLFWSVDSSGENVTISFSAGSPAPEAAEIQLLTAGALVGQAARTRQRCHWTDNERPELVREIVSLYSGMVPCNVLVVPIQTEDGVTGVIELVNADGPGITASDTKLIELLGNTIGSAFENRQLRQRVAGDNAQLKQLRQSMASLAESASTEIPHLARNLAVRMLQGEGGAVFRYDAKNRRFHAASIFSDAFAYMEIPDDRGLCGQVFEKRKAIRKPAYEMLPYHLADLKGQGIGPVIAVPLSYGNEFIGVIVVHRRNTDEPFTQIDEWLLELFVSYFAALWHLAEVSESEDRSRLLPDVSGVPAMMSVTAEGAVDKYTYAAQRILGFGVEEVIGKPVDRFYKGGLVEASAVNRLIRKQNGVVSHVAEVNRADGTTESIRLWGEPLSTGGSLAYFVRESDYQLMAARQSALSWVISSLPDAISRDASLEELLLDCLQSLHIPLGGPTNMLLYLHAADTGKLQAPPISAGLHYPHHLTGTIEPDSLPAWATRQTEPISISDVARHPITRDADFWRREKTRAVVACPLRRAGALVGVLLLNYPTAHDFESWEHRRLAEFADSFARVVDCVRRVTDIRVQNERQQARFEVTRLIGDEISFSGQQIVPKILAGLENNLARLELTATTYLFWIEGSNQLVPWRISSIAGRQMRCLVESENHIRLYRQSLDEKEITCFIQPQESCSDPHCLVASAAAIIAVPLYVETVPVGVIMLLLEKHPYLPVLLSRVQASLEEMAPPIAAALFRYRLQRQFGQLDLLKTLTREAAGGQAPYDVTRLATQQIRQHMARWFGNDIAVSIGLIPYDRQDWVEWTPELSSGFIELEGFHSYQATDTGLLREAVHKREIVWSGDCVTDERCAEYRPTGMHAEMMAPIYFNQDLLGALDIYSRRANVFGAAAVEILRPLLAQLQLAIYQSGEQEKLRAEAVSQRLSHIGVLLGHGVGSLSRYISDFVGLPSERDLSENELSKLQERFRQLMPVVATLDDLYRFGAALEPGDSAHALELAPLITEIYEEYGQQPRPSVYLVEDLPPVLGHRPVLKQILRELLVNSRDSTAKVTEGKFWLNVYHKDDYVYIEISDSAPPFSPTIRHSIRFLDEPANPAPREGHYGVTLREIRHWVRGWGGDLDLRQAKTSRSSDPKIILTLKVAPMEQLEASVVESQLARDFAFRSKELRNWRTQGEIINSLVIDDNDTERASYERLLRAYGFSVFGAADAASANDILRRYRIDLALVDLYLSDSAIDVNGLQVASQIIRLHPHACVVLASWNALNWQGRARLQTGEAHAFWNKHDGEGVLAEWILKEFCDDTDGTK
jgi:GAF domain-containing protein/CheY-like chemotaxis protein